MSVSLSCTGSHYAPSWVHLSVPGSGSEGFGYGKRKIPTAQAEKQLYDRRLEKELCGGTTGAVWIWAGACPAGPATSGEIPVWGLPIPGTDE